MISVNNTEEIVMAKAHMKILQRFNIIIIFFVLLLPNVVFANSYSSIYYTIQPLFKAGIPIIKVTAEVKGKLSDQLIIDLPYEWAGAKYVDQIHNIKVLESNYKFTVNKKENHQLIITIPKEIYSIKISYEIHQKAGNPSHVHETIIRKDLIHSPGNGLFAIPDDMKATDEIQLSVEWKTIPRNWNTISSHGYTSVLKFVGSRRQLLHALYSAGKLRIYQIGDKNTPVYLSLYGTFDIPDNIISSSLTEIIRTQRTFFNDQDFPYYAISLIEGDNPYSMGGTRLDNSFTAYLPKGINQRDYYILFAHEHLHNWLGGKLSLNDKEEELDYWWTEGFTDYYSRVLAFRSGGITIDEFVSECNQLLKNYYLSPVINKPNSAIKKNFWKDHNIQQLPYYRGFVFAIYLNGLIKLENDNNSLDNIMLGLFKSTGHKKFSAEFFKNASRNYIPQGIEQEVAEFIDKGKTIDLSSVMTILPIEKALMGAYDLGFNGQSLEEEKIIKNIIIKSNAYKSGLRNGDKVIKWSVPKGRDPDQIITIVTKNKTFRYRPENPNRKEIYQFKNNLSSQDKIMIKKFFGYDTLAE